MSPTDAKIRHVKAYKHLQKNFLFAMLFQCVDILDIYDFSAPMIKQSFLQTFKYILSFLSFVKEAGLSQQLIPNTVGSHCPDLVILEREENRSTLTITLKAQEKSTVRT